MGSALFGRTSGRSTWNLGYDAFMAARPEDVTPTASVRPSDSPSLCQERGESTVRSVDGETFEGLAHRAGAVGSTGTSIRGENAEFTPSDGLAVGRSPRVQRLVAL